MKVYFIVSNENNLGELTTNCEGVFLSKDKALKQLEQNEKELMDDKEFMDEKYDKYVDEDCNDFKFTAMNKDNGEIEYIIYQCVIEKEITE